MKRFWQMVIRFRIVLAALSILALLATFWLRNVLTQAPAPTRAAEMPSNTAVTMGNSIAEPPQKSDVPAEDDLVSPIPQTPSSQGGTAVSVNPNTTVKDAIAAPTVQSNQASSFETTNPYTAPQQGLLNDMPKEKVSKVGEQF